MNHNESESGYLAEIESGFVENSMTDVEIIRVTVVNVIARGRRYGRLWFLKGLREELRGSTAMRRQLMKEFEIHSRLRHPAVVQAIGLEDIPTLGPCIVEEWIEGKNLSELMRERNLSKTDRQRIMREIVGTVAYLHSRGVVHRDIKPANIMVRDAGGEVVLIDFGLADTGDYVELKQAAGTLGFISPEQMEKGGAQTSDDVYSLGVTMLEFCPEYRKIAGRCTGPVGNRPNDARALLKALDRHDKRPKIIGFSIMAMLTGILAAFGVLHIMSLTESSREAEKQVATVSEENRRNAERAVQLTDSLRIVSSRMNEAEAELKRVQEYNEAIERAITNGHGLIDETLQRYDRNVFSKLTPENQNKFTDELTRLMKELQDITEKYCISNALSGLSENDREKIRLDMYNYYTITMSKYHDKWIKQIFPTYHQNN